MIKVIYNKVCGRCVQSEPLTSGMVGQPIHFEYSHDFDGLTLTAVFTNGKTTVDVLNPGNQCVIPHEVLDTVGALVNVGIYAARGNELVIPTVYATIGVVLKGADPSGDVSADPTLPIWAQTQALIGNLSQIETETKDSLVAAINEVKQTTDTKQDKLIAGENITIAADGKTISATGGGGGGSSIALDTTLSEAGKAADAKAVGDALAGKQDTLIQSGASVGQIVKISAVDDMGKPTAWEAINIPESAQPDWNQNDNTQPDYVKNRPFYLEKTLFIELTKDDFTVNNQDGRIKYMYRSTPKLDWFTSEESIAFEIELVGTNGRHYTATQDSLDVSVENDTTDDDYEYWTYYSDLFDIVSGVDLDFYNDEYYYKDEWGVLVSYSGIELSEINIKIYRVDVKKIPEICLDAAIGKTAITVGSVVYGSEDEIPTNVVIPNLSIPISPTGYSEGIYYDRIYEQLRTSDDLLPYKGIVDYAFAQPMPTTAGSYISFDISSEGDTLWDKIGWNSPWSFGKYLTFRLSSYYMGAGGVTADGKIEFLSRGNNSILAGTAVAVSSSEHLYTVVLKYTNNYKTLNVTIKCVA